MKMYEALAMLNAAKNGCIPSKTDAVRQYGKFAKRTLRQMGFKNEELNSEYPDDQLKYGLFLMCNHPTYFARQSMAAAAWLTSRN